MAWERPQDVLGSVDLAARRLQLHAFSMAATTAFKGAEARDDLVAALDAVRAEEDRLASRITSCGYFCSHRSAKTPNPDDPTPIFVRGRESTCVPFVLENPDLQAASAFIFAMELRLS